ncbi:MAG: hypothetical protein PHP62_05220, partial [Candidatus Moranbacteria bacterium]|nr:hypothetical protein [Candidatus Moranbacteria bacterium]
MKGFDFHCHFRQDELLKIVINLVAKHYEKAVAMGNTKPAIVTADDAEKYEQEIMASVPPGCNFKPLMTQMLTTKTTPEIVIEAAKRGFKILKYIPKGVSNNPGDSVPLENLHKFYPVLQAAKENDVLFSIHLETLVDSRGHLLHDFDREEAAIPTLDDIVKSFPGLRITAEHASTSALIDYVRQAPMNVRATLTIHYAVITYEDVFTVQGEILNPYYYCKPIAKRPSDRQAVIEAMISGDRHFLPGSDLAPHLTSSKQSVPPPPGIFALPQVLKPLQVQIFSDNNALKKLNDFNAV